MMQLIEVFQANNYKVTFASANVKSKNAFNLEVLGIDEISILINDSSFDVFIKTFNPDIVLFDRFMVEEQFGWRVAEHCPKALRILDTEDLHCLRKGRANALKDNKVFDKSYLFNETSKREMASIYRCDLSLIISEEEMEILKNQFKVSEHLLYYLPFLTEFVSLDDKRKLPKFNERQHFIMIGNFLHNPNYDAVLFLKEAIWPLIRKKLPEAEIQVYGAYASEKIFQLTDKKERFIIKGFADDVNEVMQNARVCLAPLRFGAGLKGKLIDAMLNGTPCVMTTIAAEGMFGDFEPNGFVADDAKEFSKKAIELYTNKIFWNGKQKNGFNAIKARFDKHLFISDFMYQVHTIQNNLEVHRLDNFIGEMLQHHTLQSTKFMSKWIEEKNSK
ncbi:MAG: glycosyltransferase family 4 protein [Flavobacteriales bacterium]|nr:glycosyltransferase family 4 protein [Flavobacteriia bacterium]NCP06446.1 glycosyltransferase family 4 protein [Flavobacteriales bacterium]NCP59958.1 glycosyltransferase family 4 protein [Flavobacteriales bacterium]NCQ14885.1 glycosyltransferase family 4 protein [Flavobacteriales bacterium]NCT14047.1 glycosyltransferase family 4 protein [Flavobacteriales bacterium]